MTTKFRFIKSSERWTVTKISQQSEVQTVHGNWLERYVRCHLHMFDAPWLAFESLNITLCMLVSVSEMYVGPCVSLLSELRVACLNVCFTQIHSLSDFSPCKGVKVFCTRWHCAHAVRDLLNTVTGSKCTNIIYDQLLTQCFVFRLHPIRPALLSWEQV